jgi:DNA-binding transcriptional MerR regulator
VRSDHRGDGGIDPDQPGADGGPEGTSVGTPSRVGSGRAHALDREAANRDHSSRRLPHSVLLSIIIETDLSEQIDLLEIRRQGYWAGGTRGGRVYKIGTVSQKPGLSVSTLRLWEDQYGLLAPERSRGGTRLYSEWDIERVLYVRELVGKRGYALGAIAGIIDEANSTFPRAIDGIMLENIYLREATNRVYIEEGRRMAMV